MSQGRGRKESLCDEEDNNKIETFCSKHPARSRFLDPELRFSVLNKSQLIENSYVSLLGEWNRLT